MKTKDKISGYIIRSGAYALFLSVAFIAASSAFNSPNAWDTSASATGAYDRMAKSPSQPRAFSFVERVLFQRAIEDVYWRHRIWPRNGGENPDPKPALDAVMSQAQLENKVTGYLHDSLMLEDYWQKPITAEQLQAEMDRMARDTKQPEVLRELFEALGNDPAVIAECLARPTLAERLITALSAQDQIRHVESSQTEALRAMSVATALGQVVYTLPEIADAGDPPCTDQWGARTATNNAPSGRYSHTAVWTGSEMIVWGGADNSANVLNTGGRYNPGTNSWTATSTTNAPGRVFHTAVWTGSDMIVWGGQDETYARVNTGGRYNPRTDSWTATSTSSAPRGRIWHTAVWSGSEMIVWGGYDGSNSNTGGRYDPRTDTWTATSTTNAPTGRRNHTAVWTGSEMIVWGGISGFASNTGGRYNPSTNTWIPTSTTNAPTARYDHTAVWTGSEMIVWGGSPTNNTGGRYDPSTDTWTATSTTNAPTARSLHTAVWTGSEMIVWGGHAGNYSFNTGGKYCGQSLTIIQPNGGEVWAAGSVQQIKWDSTNLKHSDHLIIQYSRDGGASWFRIAQDIPAFAFGYWWQVDTFPTTQGRVKILVQEDLSITDQSDANFTVQGTPYITLLRPNGGESWTVGQYQNIHWSRQNPGGNTVDIDYSTDNGTTWIRIATQAEDTGWYLWNVPGPATTTAKARIRFHETPSVTDTSDAVFTIVPAT